MLAPTTALAERAGRCHSSEWVISRTGTTLAACQANMPSTCRGDACPWQVSSSPTVRQASMCTPHRRASNNAMATKPSRQVKTTRQREVVRAAPSCSHCPSVDTRPAIANKDDGDDEPGKPGNERHLVGLSGCRPPWSGQRRLGQSGQAQSPSRRNVESKQTACATSRFAAADCRAAAGLPRQHSGRRSYLGSTLIGIAALGVTSDFPTKVSTQVS